MGGIHEVESVCAVLAERIMLKAGLIFFISEVRLSAPG